MIITDPKGKELANEMGEMKMQFKINAIVGGAYQICLTSKERSETKFEIKMETGDLSEDRF